MLGEPKVAPMAQLVPLASYQVTVEAEREREAKRVLDAGRADARDAELRAAREAQAKLQRAEAAERARASRRCVERWSAP